MKPHESYVVILSLPNGDASLCRPHRVVQLSLVVYSRLCHDTRKGALWLWMRVLVTLFTVPFTQAASGLQCRKWPECVPTPGCGGKKKTFGLSLLEVLRAYVWYAQRETWLPLISAVEALNCFLPLHGNKGFGATRLFQCICFLFPLSSCLISPDPYACIHIAIIVEGKHTAIKMTQAAQLSKL